MSATNQLSTRVSDETKVLFDKQRKELGLSTNQFLKFLVLAVQDRLPDADELQMEDDASEEEVHRALAEWLRGK